VTDVSGWMDGWMLSNFFFKLLRLLQFSPILTKLGTRVLRANTHKTVEQIFKISLLKFLSNF